MLTKEEITQKKNLSPDATSDSGPSSDEKLAHKRFLIILAISLTIGLSLIFFIYRQTQEFLRRPTYNFPSFPQFNLPQPATSSPGLDNLTSVISSHIINNSSKWNITVMSQSVVYNWPSNHAHLSQVQAESVKAKIAQLPVSTLLSALLPQGLKIQEASSSTPQLQKLTALITPPGKSLLIDLEYQGTPQEFQTVITNLIPAIYWEAIHTSL